MKLVPCFFSKQGSTAKGSWLGSLPRYHFHMVMISLLHIDTMLTVTTGNAHLTESCHTC